MWHLGTFCGDGTYTLPVNHKITLGYNIFTVVPYSLPSVVAVQFMYTVGVSRESKGIINICEKYAQQTNNKMMNLMYFYDFNRYQLTAEKGKILYYWYHTYLTHRSACNLNLISDDLTYSANINRVLLTHKGHVPPLNNKHLGIIGHAHGCTRVEALHAVSVYIAEPKYNWVLNVTSQSSSSSATVPVDRHSVIAVSECDACRRSFTIIDIDLDTKCNTQRPVSPQYYETINPENTGNKTNQQVYIMYKCGKLDIKESFTLVMNRRSWVGGRYFAPKDMIITLAINTTHGTLKLPKREIFPNEY